MFAKGVPSNVSVPNKNVCQQNCVRQILRDHLNGALYGRREDFLVASAPWPVATVRFRPGTYIASPPHGGDAVGPWVRV